MDLSLFRKIFYPPNPNPANGLTLQVTQELPPPQLPFPLESQSHSPHQQQTRPVDPWSEHYLNLWPSTFPPSGPSPSPFPRYGHALPATASAAGKLFLFGGLARDSLRNDLYVISTRDLSATLLETSGEAPCPRFGPAAAHIGIVLLIWGGATNIVDHAVPNKPEDDSLYLLSLESRKWTRVVVNGPRPVGRCYHAVTMVGSKFFVFGGHIDGKSLNDMWAFDLKSLQSNPVWDSYKSPLGDKKPPPRGGHVLVTISDRIILFGGSDGQHYYNDTWLFDVSTRRWTELQCTGYTPPPRQGHAAALVDDVMFVFGGRGVDGAHLDELIAFTLSTQRWFIIRNKGSSPSRRWGHAMASEGTRIFVLGGGSPAGARGDESALIHVFETNHIQYPNPNVNAFKPSEETTQLVRRLSAGSPTWQQPQHPMSSSSNAVPDEGDVGRLEREHLVELEWQLSATLAAQSERDKRLAQLTEELALKSALLEQAEGNAKEATKHAGLKLRENMDRLSELERQLSATLAAQAERDQRVAQLTDDLALKSAQLEQAEANAKEATTRAGLDLREHEDRLHAQTSLVEQKDAELANLQAKLDELLLSRDQDMRALEQAQSALQKATSRATDAEERSQRASKQVGKHETELAGVRGELRARKSELEAARSRLTDAENGWAKSKAESEEATKRAGLELREHAVRLLVQTSLAKQKDAELVNTQAKFDELQLSRDQQVRSLEQALQKATSRAADANGRNQRASKLIGKYETELAGVRDELGATKSELEAVHLRLTDAENSLAKSKAEAEANAAEATKRAGLELREHVDRLLAQTSLAEQKDAVLVNMQAKLDELLLACDRNVRGLEEVRNALKKATSRAADADERSQRAFKKIEEYEAELAGVRAELEARKSELEAVRNRIADAENGWAKSKPEAGADAAEATKSAGPEKPERAKGPLAQTSPVEQEPVNDELLPSHDQHVPSELEQDQNTLEGATSHAADADEGSHCAHAELEARKSESEAARSPLTDAEKDCAENKTNADTSHAMTTPGLVGADEDRLTRLLTERIRVEMASLRLGEKSSEEIQTRNEG